MSFLPVSAIAVGDEVFVPHLGWKVVSELSAMPEGVKVVYFQDGEETFENRARQRGRRRTGRLVELSLRPLQPSDELEVVPGSKLAAKRLRRELERHRAEVLAASLTRRSRLDDAPAPVS